jgi:D-beta-D-heptose 7-phosphate kinase/D-beta-D-heptose 1-phosphate adenosyltransferase
VSPGGRVLDQRDAAAWAASLRESGRRIVFTNGVFDILHAGHIRYLETARAFGDALIVAVNADASVRAIKGPSRPVNPENERAEMLAALASVDAVVIFGEATPARIIDLIQPDVLVKGADWAADAIVGRETVERRGGRVERVKFEDGRSTSAIIEKVRNLPGSTPA